MYILIHVTSQTQANGLLKLLSSHGIYASVRKTPFFISRTGCGYCIKIAPGELERAMEAIKKSGMPYKAVYEVEGTRAGRLGL